MSEIEFMTVQISAKTYSGFQYKIPKDIFNNMIFSTIIIIFLQVYLFQVSALNFKPFYCCLQF